MKKLLTFCLALLMVGSAFVGCATKPSNNDHSGQNTVAPGETEDPFADGVPDKDYEGRVFTIAAPWPEDWGVKSYDRAETNGDNVNDAIYKRNRAIEKRFNIKIETLELGDTGSQTTEYAKYVMNNEDIIDIIAVGYYQSAKPLIMKDYLVPWNDVPHINLEKDWWNHNITNTLSILGNQYLIVGDVNWFTMPETSVCYFNKVLAKDLNIENLYDTVDNNQWTFDKLYTIAKSVAKDLNGDSKYDDSDQYGCIQNTIIGVTGFVYAADYHTVVMQDNGPVLNFNTEKMQNIIEYLIKLCKKDNISYTETFDFTPDSVGIPIFFENRALFYFDVLMHAETFRGYESDFGILPYPKYDETQANYTSYCNQWGLACGLPNLAQDHERTGAILEAMCALSRKLIVPAYYDKALKNRVSRDDESEDMLDLIFENVIYDYGISFCTNLDYLPAKYFVEKNSTDLSSWYAKNESRLEKNYSELYEYIAEHANTAQA